MSKPKREDFPPGREGFMAWRKAMGDDVEPAKGPWDPAKWSGATPKAVLDALADAGRGPGAYEGGGRRAEVYRSEAKPPLRVRYSSDVQGKDVLNRVGALVHPMELQRVVPGIAQGDTVQLDPLRPGSPFAPGDGGRPGITVKVDADEWSATVGGDSATGDRADLVALMVLYAEVVLTPHAANRRAPPWVATVREARDKLLEELGDAALRPARGR